MRSALLLTLAVCFVMCMLRSMHMTNLPWQLDWIWTFFEMLLTLVCFGGGAFLGLCVLDGDHRQIVPMRKLSRAQLLWLSLLGILAIAPITLISDIIEALTHAVYAARMGVLEPSQGFLQRVFQSALLAPICEELFFRGYLLHALVPYGRLRAAAVVSLCFALVHPLDSFVPLALFGALLCWMALHTQSLLAPVLVHMSYNLAVILAYHLGCSSGWSLASCALRLALCAAFMAVLKRAYAARKAGGTFVLWEGGKLSRREMGVLAAAALLLIVRIIQGG